MQLEIEHHGRQGGVGEKTMNGSEFVKFLVERIRLNIPSGTKHQWSQRQSISPTVLNNAFGMFERQKFYGSIAPLVEFHELSIDHGKKTDSFANRISSIEVLNKLQDDKSIGIYAFFDASGRVIYIGKTELNTLFSEMERRYWNKSISGRIITNGKSSPLDAKINDVAKYFSAYKIDKHLISGVEALLTRIIINNASNIHVESFHKPQ